MSRGSTCLIADVNDDDKFKRWSIFDLSNEMHVYFRFRFAAVIRRQLFIGNRVVDADVSTLESNRSGSDDRISGRFTLVGNDSFA